MRKYDTILFDLDGTILDTLPDLWHSANYALNQLGYPVRSFEEVRTFVGNGVGMLMRRALPLGTDDTVWRESVRLQKEYYMGHLSVDTVPYEGITDFLRNIKAEGFTIGVVSNKFDSAVQKLINIYFPGVFGKVTGSREDMPLKPDPALSDMIISSLGSSRERTIYVGDSEVDFDTSVNGHMRLIMVDWGFRPRTELEKTGAEFIVSDTAELHTLIHRITE